jgi:hypothetical protein
LLSLLHFLTHSLPLLFAPHSQSQAVNSSAYVNADVSGNPDYADADPAGYADADPSANGVQPAYEDPNDMATPTDWGTPITNDVPALPPKRSAASSIGGEPAGDEDYHDYEDPDMGDLYEDPDAALNSSQGPPPVQRRAAAMPPANVLPGVAMPMPTDNRRVARPESALIVPDQAPLPAYVSLFF